MKIQNSFASVLILLAQVSMLTSCGEGLGQTYCTFCQQFGPLLLSRRRVRDGSRSGNEILMGFQCVVGTEMMHFQIKYHKYECRVNVSQLNDNPVVLRLTFVHVNTIASVTTTAFSLGRCLSSSSANKRFKFPA